MARTRKTSTSSSARKSIARAGVTGKASGQAGKSMPQPPRKVMVIVHGAGSFPSDYYKPLVAAIEQRLGGPFNYVPVYYADITNPLTPGVGVLTVPPDSPAAAKFKQDFLAEMQRAYDAQQTAPQSGEVTASSLGTRNVGSLDLVETIVKEVGQYLFTPSIAARIQTRLVAGLDQAAQQSDEIVFASLSLGTVVAFDVLKLFADRYKISYWFTTGCPLGKLRRLDVRPPGIGAIAPTNVAHWYNLYDTHDVIAGAIGPEFGDYRIHDIYVQVGNDPISAHDYFNNGQTLDMLADAMR